MNEINDKQQENTSLQKAGEYPVSFPSSYAFQEEKEIHLRDYLRVILRRKWIVMTFFVIAVTTALLGTFLMTPIYRASVTIKIDNENPNVVNFKDVYQAERSEDSYYQTQFKILRSRNLAKRVIRSMKLDQNAEFAGYVPPQKPRTEGVTAGAANMDEDVRPSLVDRFLANLSVEPQPKSMLVKVSFDSPDPALAASVANEVGKAFINYNVESKFDATLQARDWLEKQLEDMKAKVERAEDNLNKYVAQNGIIFLSDGGGDSKDSKGQSMVSKRLADLSEQLVQATSDRVTKEVMYRESQRQNGEAIAAVQNNPLIQSLQKEYASAETEFAQLSKIYKPDYPKMVLLKTQSNQIKKRIDAETRKALEGLRVDYEAAVRKEHYLSSALEKYRGEVTGQNEKMVQYQILKRDADTNRELYNSLLQRLKEVGVTASLTATNIQILDRAEVPRGPYKPDKRRNMMIAIMVGLLGGIGLAFFVEYLDNTVKTADDVEKEVSLPSLGLVPQLSKKGEKKDVFPVITFEDKKSPVSEAYRSIGTYIQFSSAGRPPKSILVTSAKQGEGKTTTVVNVAVSLIHTYGKGIVIDCDMRRPQLHKIFGVDNSRGLSAYLAGHMEVNDGLIQQTKVENLDVVTSGIIPPNPSELLSSYRFKDLMGELFPTYSFILIDSPPVLGLSDSLVLSTLIDGVVMVTRAGSTPKDAAVQARKLLQGVNAKILGVVLNGMTETDLRYGSYSYYYSHYYGDGYEDHKEKRKRRKKDAA